MKKIQRKFDTEAEAIAYAEGFQHGRDATAPLEVEGRRQDKKTKKWTVTIVEEHRMCKKGSPLWH